MEKIKKRLYFFESQVPMDGVVYLPYVSGLLQAYAQTFEIIRNNYEFMPFLFIRDSVANFIKKIENPDVMAFSVCIWNHQISLAVAKAVKEKYPNCIIIFGGPQMSKGDEITYPFINHIVFNEGEKQFIPLLAEVIGEKLTLNNPEIDEFPSPYTMGLYERYFTDYPNMTFQAIIETDRSCPFHCAFCWWGQAELERKIKFHDLKYVEQEAEWIGKHGIKYVFLANANSGMYLRDQDVAKIYVKVKEKYNFPEKVRCCYGKNKTELVYAFAKILHNAGLGKAVTLARQSNSPEALEAISRSNIKLSTYDELSRRYNQEGISTYTELLLGLPGETKESFKKGLDEVASSPTQIFVYHTTVLPNTTMADPAYIAKHGIKTVRVPLTEIHGEIRKPEYVTEYEDIVIETATMPMQDWIDCAVYSWMTQLRCVFGVEKIPGWVDFYFKNIAYNIIKGESRGQVDLRFGNIYWEPEEMAYLVICMDSGLITEDPKDFARENVLWGRKSKVQKVKETV